MEFNPNNHIVKRCLQAMAVVETGNTTEATKIFLRAWEEATNDFEKFLAAWYVAGQQNNTADQLGWYQSALAHAIASGSDSTKSALPSIYTKIAGCHEALGDMGNAKTNHGLAASFQNIPADNGPFYHGTRANLQAGGQLVAGHLSNYQPGLQMNHIYFTAIANAAGLAAALAKGDGRERVYIVEPTGPFENDPNVTDKKFPGNPTRSYRTTDTLNIIGEITDWAKQSTEDIQNWREKLDNNKGEIIN